MPQSDKDTVLSLLRQYLLQQQRSLLHYAEQVLTCDDAEPVHRARVATRKLRAALQTFEGLLPIADKTHLNKQLRWLSKQLGKVRDLDVYRQNLEHYRSALPHADQAALDEHRHRLGLARQQQATALRDALQSARYRKLLARLDRAAAHLDAPDTLRRWGDFKIRDGVDKYLRGALAEVVRRAQDFKARRSPKKLHAVRIESKKYRYLLELFEPVYAQTLKKPLTATRELQKILGEHQDACQGQESIRAFAANRRLSSQAPAELLALGRILDAHARKTLRVSTDFSALWSSFEKEQPSFPIAR
jgi:CHAD domain-containing protein